jgi:hypothetical protein
MGAFVFLRQIRLALENERRIRYIFVIASKEVYFEFQA